MIDVRQAWRGHPVLADLAVAAAAAALTLILSRARRSGLSVYPQLAGSTPESIVGGMLPISWGYASLGSLVPLLACAALCLRRRHPAGVAVTLIVLSVGWPLVVPVLMALFTVATACPARTTWWITAVALVPVPVYLLIAPSPGPLTLATAVSAVTLVAGAVGWGLAVGGLRERAVRAEAEAAMRAERAQQHAREEVAREMHDVLAHRLSLLSMHAGALEYHPGAPPEQLAQAVGVIRHSATQALEDLQDVLKVLRAPVVSDHTEPPQPTQLDVTRLIEESRAAGAELQLRQRLDDPATMSPATARTAYRLLQEALTNHRKHAPGAPVSLNLAGGPRDGLSIQVTNPLQTAPAHPVRGSVPGSGQGLIGMKERVDLAGGRLHHHTTHTDFHLDVWLPWTA
ncbi:sensor histidine kinase [Streptomyces sp. NBC_00038]|uniref:sensor histidine kinase n=1 Tax=Streptomyces sp. NBC_00038 TaxID=2903615 RepID=UPI002251513B|nr:histidine kinase [Streptomyces sp. NBC_00038]MCX5559241.1 histidine kinase [Streptomyces sp. NBC_00038]